MRKFKVIMETPYAGQQEDEYFEVPDDATDEEIEGEAREIFFNLFGYGCIEVKDEEGLND